MRYYIIAGEASGDLHGSRLMQGLMENDPNAQIRFWGGDAMSAVGGEMVRHFKETAVMGFVEVLGKLDKVLNNLHYCKTDILQFKPDVIILIDFAGFNLKIAKFAKKHKLTVFYYIAPKVWAWKESRVKQLKRYVDKLFIIFPFEVEYFKKHGIKTEYYGNPLVDKSEPYINGEFDAQAFRKFYGINDKDIIAVLPGSRKMEINYLLPRVLQIYKEYPQYRFVIAAAPNIETDFYLKVIGSADIKFIYGKSYELLSVAKAAIVSSGTAALEAALLNCPQVVCYGGNPISFAIAKFFVKVKYVSLINLILDRPCVKELLQYDCTPQNIQKELDSLFNPILRTTILSGYNEAREKLGESGSALRIAKAMTDALKKSNQ